MSKINKLRTNERRKCDNKKAAIAMHTHVCMCVYVRQYGKYGEAAADSERYIELYGKSVRGQ